jgi:ribosome biogenesis GTPase
MHYDDFFKDDKKLSRQERKRLSNKDRSKFKKTDQGPKMERPEKEGLKRGRVLSVSSQGYEVDFEQRSIQCTLRGALKKEKTLYKNIVAVGDFVHFEELNEGAGVIEWVEPRGSILSRADNLSRLKAHIIAVNIDQVLITTSLIDPVIKPSLLDRYVIAAKKGKMEPVLVINKWDLLEALTQEGKDFALEVKKAYESAGIAVIAVSVKTGEGIESLKKIMQGKASVFSGQSGVGKTSLINETTGLLLDVGETVQRTGKGAHTTTQARLVRLDCGGFCIDTPGVQSFGLLDLQESEVSSYYSEIKALSKKCRYPNCTHTHEPDCAVQKGVEKGKISPVRYDSYVALLQEIDAEHRRR